MTRHARYRGRCGTGSVQRTSDGAKTRSKRSSLWVEDAVGWQMRYHQGTREEPLARSPLNARGPTRTPNQETTA